MFTGWQLYTERLCNQWAVDITKVICESPSSRSVSKSPLRKWIQEKNPHNPARPITFFWLRGSGDKQKREGACRHAAGVPATQLKSLTSRLDLEASPKQCYLSGTPFTHTRGHHTGKRAVSENHVVGRYRKSIRVWIFFMVRGRRL